MRILATQAIRWDVHSIREGGKEGGEREKEKET
jgi:hypothetical protein